MKFVSIKEKLIRSTMAIVSLIFVLVLSAITFMNIQSTNKNIAATEENICNALIAKGKTLVSNNARSLRIMAEENAFTAMADTISSTVKEDPDIEYGIYMDSNSIAWIKAAPENPQGLLPSPLPLNDPVSQWAGSLKTAAYQKIRYGKQELIEFAAPVSAEDDIVLGVVRYALNTSAMAQAQQEALKNGIRARNQGIVILLLIGFCSLILTYLIIIRVADKITRPIGSLVESAKTISEGNYSVTVQLATNDEIGDLALHFETMRGTVKKYIDHLQDLVDEKMQQVNDILNNIDQGLFTVNLDGSVNKEYSARANGILHVQDIASCPINEILRLDSRQERAFQIWLDLVRKRHDRQRWKKLARLAPVHELELGDPDPIPDYVSIAYQKIYDKQGRLSKIMILAMDETEKRMKAMQMAEERQTHENEMKIILSLVNTPPDELSEFMEDTEERIRRVRGAITDHVREQSNPHMHAVPESQIHALYRDIHTVKGNSGSYGFEMLSQHAHQAEDMLEQLGQCSADQRAYILKGLMKSVDQMREDMGQVHEKIALIFGKDEQATVPVPRPRVEQITSLCRKLDRDTQPEEIRELIDNCIRLSWKPLESLTRKYQKIVSRIARRHQKTIKFVVTPERVFFPANIFSDADDALTHLVRNAADHGIEAPEIRQELGKGVGRVFFELLEENENRIIKISDDGQGIDTEKLVSVCIQKGLITREEAEKLSAEEKLNLIFCPGISTSEEVSDISGRGVGMDVVLKKVEALGGTVSVESEPEKGSTVTLVLPKYDAD